MQHLTTNELPLCIVLSPAISRKLSASVFVLELLALVSFCSFARMSEAVLSI